MRGLRDELHGSYENKALHTAACNGWMPLDNAASVPKYLNDSFLLLSHTFLFHFFFPFTRRGGFSFPKYASTFSKPLVIDFITVRTFSRRFFSLHSDYTRI